MFLTKLAGESAIISLHISSGNVDSKAATTSCLHI